ncbi:6-phosphofructokinase [Maledivibacter halophilus]|uniref:Pyrophosphate--fructose 6-phosphate 1-phosphotransferase n=1 Tax=Maledivibacter halophilus TaxID=36842 RepID=A0A1T5KD09_9FIRM|nr:6-phosphofructokinase [Maledivibacter halophilus]SKC61510.1 6-phosphofructokinase 1 [Maledivibacter halophilus]
MKNCLVAQSGGPTAVINSSVVGVVEGNQKLRYYDNVYGGINGIEGVLQNKIINLSELSDEDLEILKYTPSSALGSCRYKMKDFNVDEKEYIKVFDILDALDVETLFYIGGNDSMDTVSKLSQYAKLKGIPKKIIGIPKTIDNDLFHTDHTPGYGSAAKYISTITLETYLDSSVYSNNGIFILETMGRDTGWLAASASLAKLNGKSVVDFIYLPETVFSKEQFLADVENRFQRNNKVYIVASEGLKDENGEYLFEVKSSNKHDSFSHVQLGGVGDYLKSLIIKNKITPRIKVLELGVTQRSAMHLASQTDILEACRLGKEAVRYSTEGHTGCMVGIERIQNSPYEIETLRVEACKVANSIKYFPHQWITPEKNNVTEKAVEYIAPLIRGSHKIITESGLPKYIKLY